MRKLTIGILISLAVILGAVFFFRPSDVPDYLRPFEPTSESMSTTSYRIRDKDGKIEAALAKEFDSERWTSGGSIDYTDHGANFVANRWLEIEWWWEGGDLLVTITRMNAFQALVGGR